MDRKFYQMDRKILFRGILLYGHRALIAYYTTNGMGMQDAQDRNSGKQTKPPSSKAK